LLWFLIKPINVPPQWSVRGEGEEIEREKEGRRGRSRQKAFKSDSSLGELRIF